MRVVVTGAAGKLGRVVVAHLHAEGYEVAAVDRVPTSLGVPSTVVDLTDFGQVLGALTGVHDRWSAAEAVVHLGAIPAPGLTTNAHLLANNVISTHNVFEAARVAGIKKVVWASSETVLGLPFDTPPPYLPVDEEYRVRPETSYSLGKAVDEEMAAHFARWDPELSIIGLRYSNVMLPEDYAAFEEWQDDPALRAWNLWSYIDARDGAEAVRLALESDIRGFEPFIIAAADTVMLRPTEELLTGNLAALECRTRIEGRSSLFSVDKARRLLGYEPTHSWRDEPSSEGD
ncbi:NAD(P)-dependent oxidoreductase [Salinibacterium sp. SYSU T00001]|uniref:NAD-dependent epimerase/dehydratase family protein n=1 Tax=Homoserinimonas sedimenticola TaxID=2986805 RepID=UPI0022369937|nr:NAD(P)-dependent oxidoreductase [Salinibacterium sedimenticola]MCW4384457.1 NAD(P)-dependent oxidoreductase [Salinibacterium sedimenticola]